MTAAGFDSGRLHVCHIVARANGGANDPRNYVLCDPRMNMSLGRRGDHIMCTFVGPAACAEARAVSAACRRVQKRR